MTDFDEFMSESKDGVAAPQRRMGLVFTSINPRPLAWQLSRLIPIPIPYEADAKIVQGAVSVAELQQACVKALNMLGEETRYMAARLQELEEQVKKDPTGMVRTIWVINP